MTRIFRVGGAQAVAAMAFGTETVPKVDKIFGPGNPWVTLAKQIVSGRNTAIDMPAGPSEVMVLADGSAPAAFAAADLLSQAEQTALRCSSPPKEIMPIRSCKKLRIKRNSFLVTSRSKAPWRTVTQSFSRT